MRKSKTFKVVAILILAFMIRLLSGCDRNVSPNVVTITYNEISINGIDNSGKYFYANSEVDTFYSEAVALRLVLNDASTPLFAQQTNTQSFAFSSAMALSIATIYELSTNVTDIKIKTLYNINDNIKKDDDVSSHFLYASMSDFYKNLSEAIHDINSPNNRFGSTILALKDTVQNDKAQFEITVVFDNGTQLKATTKLFHILKN